MASMDSPVVMGAGSLSSSTEPDHLVPVKKFHQGEPVALGITQIFIGIAGIALGILIDLINFDSDYYMAIKIPYWGGILYIISGSLAVAAARNPKIPLVKGMLAMNVISAITAGVGIGLLLLIIAMPLVWAVDCSSRHDTKEKCDEMQNIAFGIVVVLTLFTILEFCIAISVAFFGCRMLCRDPFTETVVVIYQHVTPANAEQHPPLDYKQPTIHP